MLTEKQIAEIRRHLEKAQNPVFYFDNDCDGLCSFVLLRKFIGRGRGVAVRSFPDLNGSYARKAQELNADYVFVLDKPVVSREFIEEIDKLGLTIVWIDHHDVPVADFENEFKNLHVYNPARGKSEKHQEPVTYMCYKITNRKEDVWLGVIGCIADHYLPDFVEDFKERFPEFWKKGIQEPFDAYYETEIGKIAMAFNFGLKDSISNVIKLQNFLIHCNSPSEVFEETTANHSLRKKHSEIREKYNSLLARVDVDSGKLIFFEYGGDISISSDLSNKLCYLYPRKYVVVAYKKGAISNLSLRGKSVKKILERVLQKIEGKGGGHEDAVGATVKTEDLEKFRKAFEDEIG